MRSPLSPVSSTAVDEVCHTCLGRRYDENEDGRQPCPDCAATGLEPQPVWLVIDGSDDLAARAASKPEAQEKLARLHAYWDEAAACGHPSAPAHAAGKRDGAYVQRVRACDAARDWDDEQGYLDREP